MFNTYQYLKTAAAYKPVHEINHPQSPITPQPVDVRMITFEDEHPVDYTTFGTDMDSRMYADELAYYNKVDRKHPKTWRTRLDTLGRTLSIPAGTLGALYAYSKIPDKVPFLHRNPNVANVLAVASGVGGFIGGLHLYDKFQNPRSRTLAAIDADIADQQEEITNNAFADSDFMDDYTKEHLRSVRTPLGRSARMNALFDKYNLPTKYQHNVKVAANEEAPAKYDGGIYFSPQPIRARVGVANAATKGESIAYNTRNAGLAASTAGLLAGGAYLAGLKNPAVGKAALGLAAGGVGAVAGGNLYLKYSDNGRKAEAKLDALKKHLQARSGLTHFVPTRFGKMKDRDGNEYITRGFTATRPAPTGRLLATQAKP